MKMRNIFLWLIAYSLSITCMAQSTITVTNLNDSGTGSLRQAINNVNNGGSIIIDPSLAGKTIVTTGLSISKNCTIEGNSITISGNIDWRILDIGSDITVFIRRVHFTKGYEAIRNYGGFLNLQSCIFSWNKTTNAYGWSGAIYNGEDGNIMISACTFYNNTTSRSGGVLNNNGTVTLTGNLFYGNLANSGNIIQNDGNVINKGYNVYDNTSYNFTFNAESDKYIIGMPISPTSFRMLRDSETANIITNTIPAQYPSVDFYGIPMTTVPLSAGASQETAQGYIVDYVATGPGSVMNAGILPNSNGLFPDNSTVTLTATANDSYEFQYWVVNGSRLFEPSPTLSLTVDGHKAVEAVFGTITTVSTTANDGSGSLREALSNAKDGSLIRIDSSLSGDTILLLSALPDITKNIIIDGNGITINGDNKFQILNINTYKASVYINRVHFTNGNAFKSSVYGSTCSGGAISNSGTLVLQSCIFSYNRAMELASIYKGYGGAVYNGRSLTVSACTFYYNRAYTSGGAIRNQGDCTLTGNLFYGNIANADSIVGSSDSEITTSLGYNLFDETNSGFIHTNGDKSISNNPLFPSVFFRLLQDSEAIGAIPQESIPKGYPTADIYGNSMINSSLAAGAVQDVLQGYLLRYSAKGPGRVEISEGNLTDEYGVETSDIISLTATADLGYPFLYWMVNNVRQVGVSNKLTLIMDGDKKIEAIFGNRVIVTSSANDGAGSLREVLAAAQDYDVIFFADNLSGKTISISNRLPAIDKNIIINGNGITISGNNKYQIMYIKNTATVSISRIHFTAGAVGNVGYASDYGGAIYNMGTLDLHSCIFSYNTATYTNSNYIYDGGGAINNRGYLSVYGSTFYKNNTNEEGGAIHSYESNLFLMGNLFCGNTASYRNIIGYKSILLSGGYNVYDDGETSGFSRDLGDKLITSLPIDTITFKPTNEGFGMLQIKPSIFDEFQMMDFYGIARGIPTAAGAIAAGSIAVTFNFQYENRTDVILAEKNALLSMPNNQVRTGYIFSGWYREEDCVNAWNFANDKVFSNLMLYAKWTENTQDGLSKVNNNLNVKIYPTIIRDGFVVSGLTTNAKLAIYSATGQKIAEIRVINNKFVPLAYLPKGVYLVVIDENGRRITSKIIKN